MRVRVDWRLCECNGICQGLCPEVFEIKGGKARVKVKEVPDSAMAACRKAALGCPCEAISIQE